MEKNTLTAATVAGAASRYLRRPRDLSVVSHNKVAVVGLGYVGLPLALLCERKGFEVFGIDNDKQKVTNLRRGESDVLGDGERDYLSRSRSRFSTNASLLRGVGTIIVSVPTPVKHDHTPDLLPLRSATEAVGKNLGEGALVIIESTVNPGVCEEVVIPILERLSGLRADRDFYFAHAPERINPGDRRYTVENIPRVIGGRSKESRDRAFHFYHHILDADLTATLTLREAESVKMVENAFRDINIAYVNELAMSFDHLGIDIVRVIKAASTKPFAFMAHYPGCGVGGHCIPVDPYYLIDYAEKNGFDHTFLKTARKINSFMPEYAISRLRDALEEAGRKPAKVKVALLGLSYKRDIADMRESPALVIRDRLIKSGVRVLSFDPYVPQESSFDTLDETLDAADAILIATDHEEFRALTPEELERHGIGVVVDGRNCLPKEKFERSGVIYRGIGR